MRSITIAAINLVKVVGRELRVALIRDLQRVRVLNGTKPYKMVIGTAVTGVAGRIVVYCRRND
jgi:hypothetical protein